MPELIAAPRPQPTWRSGSRWWAMKKTSAPTWKPDADLLVTRDILPLAESFAAVRRAFEREREPEMRTGCQETLNCG
jgi:hypothetical protein